MKMYRVAEKATAGSWANEPADSWRKTATTRIRARIVKHRNSTLPLRPIHLSTTSPTDLPSWRIDATSEPMSCGPPRNAEPMRHHR